jgi:hypothetical protein
MTYEPDIQGDYSVVENSETPDCVGQSGMFQGGFPEEQGFSAVTSRMR